MRKIYLDHAGTTVMHPDVLKAMKPFFNQRFGNPSSIHSVGREAEKTMNDNRKKIAEFLSAGSEEIIFTSGGTESDNLALKGIAFANKDKGKHIITSAIEHNAVLQACEWLEKQGFYVTYLHVDKYGLVSL